MKLIIVDPEEKYPSGFTPKNIVDGEIDLSDISDNECEEILIRNAFTQVPIDNCVQILVQLSSKLRRGGIIRFNGVDSRTVARKLISGIIDDKEYNNLVYSCKSMLSIPLVKEVVHASGLKIETLKLEGFNYDVTATR